MKKPQDTSYLKWHHKRDKMPPVGLDVLVVTIKNKEVLAHISNSNSWYDYDKPIEYEVEYWGEQIFSELLSKQQDNEGYN